MENVGTVARRDCLRLAWSEVTLILRGRGRRDALLVLVVDDDVRTCDVLRALLEDEGYRVETTGNGREALLLLNTTRPSFVLCDVRMPVLDGYEVVKQMQAKSEFRSIPVALMSGTDRPRTLPSGCQAFLSKPVDSAALILLIQRLAVTSASAGPARFRFAAREAK